MWKKQHHGITMINVQTCYYSGNIQNNSILVNVQKLWYYYDSIAKDMMLKLLYYMIPCSKTLYYKYGKCTKEWWYYDNMHKHGVTIVNNMIK